MGENGVNGSASSGTQWKVGFMNTANKYLTAETFGHKVNASGVALKKKQIWSIEQDPANNWVFIRSHLGCYMTSDKYGTITAEAEEKGEDEKFVVEYSKEGRWAFKNKTYSMYLRGKDDQVSCCDQKKIEKEPVWWSIQLYVHPQINLRNVKRKKYARLNTANDNLEITEITPWGADSLLIFDFEEGKYTIRSCDNRYLHRDGTLQTEMTSDTKFTMEIHQGCLAFKDNEGRYLTGVGQGVMKSRNTKVSPDELFTIEDSNPQVQIISHGNGKSVSVKQGTDVSANQQADPEELGDTEIFQMEYNKAGENWAFRASTNKYWALQAATSTIQATSQDKYPQSYFTIDWQDDGSVGIQDKDGKYLSNKPTGILFSTGTSMEDNNKFYINIVNRPLLVLKSEFGFVGTKGGQYICNKSKYDTLTVQKATNGTYTLKGPDNKYVGVDDSDMVCSEDSATKFMFQFCGQSLLAIRAPNGRYLKGEQNGLFKAQAEEINATSLWEY